jgi:hypothetical protein
MNRTNESLPRTPTLAAGPGGVHVRVNSDTWPAPEMWYLCWASPGLRQFYGP